MPKDVRTNVIVSAETKGFDSARQKVSKFSDEGAKGVTAQAKGFEDAKNSSAAYSKSLEKINKMDFKDVQKQIGGLKDHLGDLHKQQLAVTMAMSEMDDQASPAYKKLKDDLKSIQQESKTAERQINSLNKAFATQAKEAERLAEASRQGRGAFIQGLAQGGLPFPAPFLQRGPGMGRQVAGMAVGRALTGGARGAQLAGGAMFGGVGGMAQAIGSIPLVGGMLGGQFQAAAQYAQQNIQWQQTKLGMAPYTERVGDIRERATYLAERSAKLRRARSRKEEAEREIEEAERNRDILMKAAQYQHARKRQEEALAAAEKEGVLPYAAEKGSQVVSSTFDSIKRGIGEIVNPFGEVVDAGIDLLKKGDIGGFITGKHGDVAAQKAIEERELTRTTKGELKSIKELDALREKNFDKLEKKRKEARKADLQYRKELATASKKYAAGPFRDIGQMGVSLMGVSKPEAAQIYGEMMQAGGGYKQEAIEQGMIGSAFAARTMFGVQPGVAGAFLGAGRRGGVVGARGAQGGGGAAFREALAEGLRLGLEGSELNRYMQETAAGIQNFEATGIEINTRSITSLARDLTDTGIAGTRAARMARGITGGIQQVGQRGIQSGLDLYMLQSIGGYRGGGATQYREARARMESLAGTVQAEGVGAIAGESQISESLRGIMRMAGGDPGAQAELLQTVLRQMGVQTSVKETDWLARSLRGEEATPEQLSMIQQERRRQALGAAEAKETGLGSEADMMQAAKDVVSGYAPGAKAQASLANKQIAVGRRMVGVVKQLENMALDATDAMSKAFVPSLSKATTELENMAKNLPTLLEYIKLVG